MTQNLNPPSEEKRDQHVRDTAETKGLSGTTPIESSIENRAKTTSARRLYRERLERMWAAAHENGTDDERERALFFLVMERVGPVVPADEEEAPVVAAAPSTSLPGNIDTVSLLVADIVAREPSAEALAGLLTGSLAAAMERLESEREGTPEQRVDIVVRVLHALRGGSGNARLAAELLRYLQNQRERTSGFYVTVANLASVASAAADTRPDEEVFLYHVVLEGLRALAVQEGWTEFDRLSPGAVANSGFNLASTLAGLARRRGGGSEDSAKVVGVLRDLKAISASTAQPIVVEPARAAELCSALGFSTDRPVELLTVLINMGSAAQSWQSSQVGLARLEASSGIAEVLATPEHAAARLFNAGISMIKLRRDTAAVVQSRILLNALGLRLALDWASDLVTALTTFDGLDCAVNLLGAVVEYQPIAATGVVGRIGPLAQQLVNLSRWSELDAVDGLAVDRARLGQAGERLGLRAVPGADPDLVGPLEGALEALRGASAAPARMDDMLLDSARLVGHAFTEVLPAADEPVALQDVVDECVASRDRAVQVLAERYARYAAPSPDATGLGPLVAAGLIDPTDWERLASRLLTPLDSVAPALRNYLR